MSDTEITLGPETDFTYPGELIGTPTPEDVKDEIFLLKYRRKQVEKIFTQYAVNQKDVHPEVLDFERECHELNRRRDESYGHESQLPKVH